jgi:hypothetical protein
VAIVVIDVIVVGAIQPGLESSLATSTGARR